MSPTSDQLAKACRERLSAKDCDDLREMDLYEALGYAFSLLIEAGVKDPEVFLKEKGVLE